MNRVRHLGWGWGARLGCCLAACSTLWGNAPAFAGDKADYTLFNPTPRESMREMSTDRPDQTESAYTVDAGHFQLEMDLVNYVHAHNGSVTLEAWAAPVLNLKLGLWNNADIRFVFDPFVHARIKSGGNTDTIEGFGDLQTRLKINLWGNDGGKTALAIMPFVKWPLPESALRNGRPEGGVIVPLVVELPAGWGMGLMTECDVVRDSANTGYECEFFKTVTLSHAICGRLSGYVEFAATVNTESGSEWIGQMDGGLTYAWTDDFQFDGGSNFGVTDSAPDYPPFIGVSWRN